jgi:hypothetical protein
MVFGTNADFCTRKNLVPDIDTEAGSSPTWTAAKQSLLLSRQQTLDFSHTSLYLIGYSCAFGNWAWVVELSLLRSLKVSVQCIRFEDDVRLQRSKDNE